MCEAVGHPVRELVRVGYGPLTLGNLAAGTSRPLLDTEIRRLRKAAGLQPPRQKRGKGSEDELVQADGDADTQHGRNPGKQQPAKQGGEGATSGGFRSQGAHGEGNAGANGGSGQRSNARRGTGKPGGSGKPGGASGKTGGRTDGKTGGSNARRGRGKGA